MLLAAIPKVEQRRMLRFFTLLPGVLGLLVSLIGVGELIAWSMGVGRPVDPRADQFIMAPVTAASFVIGGLALVTAQRRDSRLAAWTTRILALLVASVALFILLQYGMGWPPTFDLLWLGQFGLDAEAHARQRMAINSALGFVIFALGLMFIDGDQRNNDLRSQFFATVTLLIAFVALVGQAGSVEQASFRR